jgi:hypothetical protein
MSHINTAKEVHRWAPTKVEANACEGYRRVLGSIWQPSTLATCASSGHELLGFLFSFLGIETVVNKYMPKRPK